MGLSFLRGMVAAVNPCGFVLLPTYLMYFLGLQGVRPGTQPVDTFLIACGRDRRSPALKRINLAIGSHGNINEHKGTIHNTIVKPYVKKSDGLDTAPAVGAGVHPSTPALSLVEVSLRGYSTIGG